MTRPAARWAAVLGWAGLLFFLSSRSQLPGPEVRFLDKVEHAAAYAVLAFLLGRAWTPSLVRFPLRARTSLIVLACMLYGVSDEVHQAFVPGRSADPLDVVADTVGAALCVLGLRRRLP